MDDSTVHQLLLRYSRVLMQVCNSLEDAHREIELLREQMAEAQLEIARLMRGDVE